MFIDNTYKEHQIFILLRELSDFYRSISHSIFCFASIGTTAISNIDSYQYSSIQGTLESINDILIKGRINDSYALLRKYYDSVIINTYTILYLSDNSGLDNIIVDKINNWLQGKEKLPEFRIMSNYIRSSNKLSVLNDLLYKDDTYKTLRTRCNNNTHYNFYYNVLLNDNEVYFKSRLKELDRLHIDLRNIFILHFAYMFFLNSHYMASSDYMDSIDCGLTPEEGSQYYVAPFIQIIYNSIIKKYRCDIAAVIKDNSSMMLD